MSDIKLNRNEEDLSLPHFVLLLNISFTLFKTVLLGQSSPALFI